MLILIYNCFIYTCACVSAMCLKPKKYKKEHLNKIKRESKTIVILGKKRKKSRIKTSNTFQGQHYTPFSRAQHRIKLGSRLDVTDLY